MSERRARYGPDPKPLVLRLWARVTVVLDPPGACWPWQGPPANNGYGTIRTGGVGARRTTTNNAMYEVCYGPLPPGMMALHHCDNPACVRPSHLYAGTSQRNARDREERGRRVTPSGSQNPNAKLTEEDVAWVRWLHQQGNTQREIGLLMGVHPATIGLILRGKTWRQ